MAPITLVYGPNSGGKSSIIQSLMLLKQTFETENPVARPATLVPRGPFVDLGSFHSLVHLHRLSRKVRLGLEFESERIQGFPGASVPIEGILSVETLYGAARGAQKTLASVLEEVAYGVVFGDGAKFNTRLIPKYGNGAGREKLAPWDMDQGYFTWRADKDQESYQSLAVRTIQAQSRPHQRRLEISEPELLEFVRYLTEGAHFPLRHPLPGRMGRFPWTESRASDSSDRFNSPLFRKHVRTAVSILQSIALQFRAVLESVSYLGPLRSHPTRQYVATGIGVQTVGKAGEYTPQVILNDRSGIEKQINIWFRQLEIPYKLEVREVGDEVTGRIINLVLKDERTGVLVGSPDVGFGLAQLLPILVEGIARKRVCICVEQPEIHLHPRLQAQLGDFFIETAARKKEPNQWVIETHSEALMLRIQRRIRQKRLAPFDVCVLYVQPGPKGSQVLPLRLDEAGEFIDEWPGGFFEEEYEEIFGDSAEW